MATLYILRTHNQNAPSTILLRIREGKEQVKISTQIQVREKDWDPKAQRVLPSDTLFKEKNAALASWDYESQKALLLMSEKALSLDRVKEIILEAKGRPVKRKNDRSFVEYYRQWATTRTESKKILRRQDLSTLNVLREFNPMLSFDDVDKQFYEDFCRWMDDVKRYKANTKGTHIKNIRAAMNAAYKDKLHGNDAFLRFKKQKEEVDAVYLTEEELATLYHLDLPGHMAKARDIFLVGCYTAMRWSDFSRLEENDIVDDTIYFTHKKTGYRVSIPLHPIVKEVLGRYGGKVPEISEQKLNEYIKDVCKEAGFTQPIKRVYYKGGVRVEEVKPKYALISSHTARRTAATNMYISGVPAYNIMLITGHTSEKTFRQYIKFEKERNAELMRNNPYFQMP